MELKFNNNKKFIIECIDLYVLYYEIVVECIIYILNDCFFYFVIFCDMDFCRFVYMFIKII